MLGKLQSSFQSIVITPPYRRDEKGKILEAQEILGYVTWKPLPWDEVRGLYSVGLSPELEDEIWSRCVIESTFSEETLDEMAGIVSTVINQILAISGYTQDSFIDLFENGMGNARQELSTNIFDQMTIVICAAFPYTPDELEKLPWPVILKRAAQAERIVGGQMPAVPITTRVPEQKVKRFNLDSEVVLGTPTIPDKRKEIKNLRNEYLRKKGTTGM